MPTSVVEMDLSAETGATVRPTYNDIVLVGSASTEPTAGYNEVNRYVSPDDVANDFSEGSDLHVASQALAQMGVQSWYCVAAERTQETTETVTDGSNTANAPIYGDETTVTVTDTTASEDLTVVPVLSDSPGTPDTGEAYVNFDSGYITSASGNDVEVDYEHVDWDGMFAVLPEDVDLLGAANYNFGVAGGGDLESLASGATSHNISMVAMHADGSTFTDDQAALDDFQETFAFVPNGDLLAVAHKSDADVASYILGQLGTNDPWFDPFWDGDGYPFETDYYRRDYVGDPETEGTFEGGDADGMGCGNVIVNVGDTKVLSNSLTTTGPDSNYRFFDVGRTETFIASEARDSLRDLRLDADQIPFTSDGRSRVLGTIRDRLSEHVGESGEPLAEVSVSAPEIEEIDENDRAKRIFPNIDIEGRLAGNIHSFGVTLTVRV